MRGVAVGGVAMLCAEIALKVTLTMVISSRLCPGRRKTQKTSERARTTPNRPSAKREYTHRTLAEPLGEILHRKAKYK